MIFQDSKIGKKCSLESKKYCINVFSFCEYWYYKKNVSMTWKVIFTSHIQKNVIIIIEYLKPLYFSSSHDTPSSPVSLTCLFFFHDLKTYPFKFHTQFRIFSLVLLCLKFIYCTISLHDTILNFVLSKLGIFKYCFDLWLADKKNTYRETYFIY